MERRILEQDRDLLDRRRADGAAPRRGRRRSRRRRLADPAEREIGVRSARVGAGVGGRPRRRGSSWRPKGTAGYVVFAEPIHAVRAARAVVDERTRVAVDCRRPRAARRRTGRAAAGPRRPPRRRRPSRPGAAARRPAHEALTAAGVGRVGGRVARAVRHRRPRPPACTSTSSSATGSAPTSRDLRVDRLPPSVPGGAGAVGAGLRAARADRRRRARRGASRLPAVGRTRGGGAHLRTGDGRPSAVRAPVRDRVAADHPGRAPPRRSAARLLAGARPGRDGQPADDRRAPRSADPPTAGWTPSGCAGRSSRRSPPAVASAHRHGVVHGRIRPENVLFDDEGNAYVADLGVDEICAGVVTLRDQRLRRPGAPRWRAGDAGAPTSTRSASSSTTCSAARRHRRTAPLAARRGCRSVASIARATDPDPEPAARFGRRADRRRCATRSPSRADPTAAFAPDPQPVPRPGGVRAGGRRRLLRSRPCGRARWSPCCDENGCWSSSVRRASASRRSSRPGSSRRCDGGAVDRFGIVAGHRDGARAATRSSSWPRRWTASPPSRSPTSSAS